MQGSRRRSQLGGMGCLVAFGLLWSTLTLAADIVIGWGIFRQLRAQTYSATTGTVTQSRIETVEGEDGATYRPRIAYTYAVTGKEYVGERYRYGEWSAGQARAKDVAAAHPVGTSITVYYSPADPADAVLAVGLEGLDLFLAMFLLPFNAIMASLWVAGGRDAYRRLVPSPTGRGRVRNDGLCLRISLSPTAPVLSGLVVAGILAFALTFVIGFGFGGSPPYRLMQVVWAVILAGGGLTWFRQQARRARGEFDLALDNFGRSLTLPRTCGRTAAIVVPVSQVTAIDVERVEKRGAQEDAAHVYAPTVVFFDDQGATVRERLVEWDDADQAECLASWLRERLRLKAADVLAG